MLLTLNNIIAFILAILLLVIIKDNIVYFKNYKKVDISKEPLPIKDVPAKPNVDCESVWDTLTGGEQIQCITDKYFTLFPKDDTSSGTSSGSTRTDDEKKFIESLPKDSESCTDNYSECSSWAANGECNINPEYMLYNCAKSCKACSYTPEDKIKLVEIYNKTMPSKCIYRGKPYPGEFQYLNKFYDYDVGVRG